MQHFGLAAEKFEALYEKYEAEGKGRETIKAQDLWFKILESQIETGTPYILFKDAANGLFEREKVELASISFASPETTQRRFP